MSQTTRALVVLALSLSPAALAQDTPPAPAQQTPAEAAFGEIEKSVQEVRRSPPANRATLFPALMTKCGEFLDAHRDAARPEHLTQAIGIWFSLAGQLDTPEEQVRARLEQVKGVQNLPDEVKGMLRGVEARLNLKPGTEAPEWTAVDIKDGSQVTLSSLRGKLVLVDFWATWCPPCKSLMEKELAPLHAKYEKDPRFLLVGLGLPWNNETAEKEKQFSEQKGYHWRKVFDATGAAGEAYGVEGIPFLVLVDEQGKILVMGSGWQVIEEVKNVLGQRLAAPAAGN